MDSLDKARRLNGCEREITLDELNKLRNFLNFKMLFNVDYTWGYTNALQDMLELTSGDYFDKVCKSNKVTRNFKTMGKIIELMIEHRQALRDRFNKYYLIWDDDRKEFKIGVEKKIKMVQIEE